MMIKNGPCGAKFNNKRNSCIFLRSELSPFHLYYIVPQKKTYLYNLRLASTTRGKYGTFTVVDHWKGHGHSFRRRFWGITDGSNYILRHLLLKTLTRYARLHEHLILVQLTFDIFMKGIVVIWNKYSWTSWPFDKKFLNTCSILQTCGRMLAIQHL